MTAILLDELFRSMIYKQGKDKMTNQEAEVILQWKSQTMKSSIVGCTVASGLTWIATRKLNTFNRLTLTGGAGFLTVLWRIRSSVDACADRILGMDGSRMQYELKKIILERYGNDPNKMKLFSKHFYREEVFSDFTPGRPISIYRQRSSYVDDKQPSDDNASEDSVKKGLYHQQRNVDFDVKLQSRGATKKQVPMNSGLSALGYGDPLDVLFGPSANEELPRPIESGNLTKSKTYSQRKARRRHRARHQHQESLSGEATQL